MYSRPCSRGDTRVLSYASPELMTAAHAPVCSPVPCCRLGAFQAGTGRTVLQNQHQTVCIGCTSVARPGVVQLGLVQPVVELRMGDEEEGRARLPSSPRLGRAPPPARPIGCTLFFQLTSSSAHPYTVSPLPEIHDLLTWTALGASERVWVPASSDVPFPLLAGALGRARTAERMLGRPCAFAQVPNLAFPTRSAGRERFRFFKVDRPLLSGRGKRGMSSRSFPCPILRELPRTNDRSPDAETSTDPGGTDRWLSDRTKCSQSVFWPKNQERARGRASS